MVDYQGRKIVIIGLGETGLSCVDFFLKQDVIPRVMDTRILPPGLFKLPRQVKCYLGGINSSWLWESDLIIISPGIAPWHPTINKAAELGIEIIGDIELFCREAKAPIIAITGSNGKSTVTMLFTEMVREAGWRVSVGGNIGIPALKILKPSTQIYVLELSSFQLETTYSLKAAAATVLNITEDHMDRYPLGMFQYSAAKLRIYNNASICIFNAENYMTLPLHSFTLKCVSFGINSGDYHLYQFYGHTWLKVKGKKVLNTNKMKMIGQYNYVNALAALALADSIKIPRAYSLKALTNFPGLPHRFQVIHKANGVLWINNSKATNVSSTEVAFNSLRINGKLWLLLGGDAKMADFSPLIKYLENDHVRLFCFGKDGDFLASLCPLIATRTETMQQAMQQIALQVKPGDIVLLSPACASFDQFQNFEHRGEVFTQLAKELG